MGLVIYFQNAWVEGFFHDGYLYSALGKHALEKGRWLVPYLSETKWSEFNQHPPFVFMLLGLFFNFFGVSFTIARIFGAIWTILTLIIFTRFVLKTFKGHKKVNYLVFYFAVAFLINMILIKKSRFPGLDTPLLFFGTCCYLSYYKNLISMKNGKDVRFSWLWTGTFFGLSLLTKGIAALLILPGFFIFPIIQKSFKKTFFSIYPWLGLILGFAIFSIWPLLLSMEGKVYIFTSYLENQFLWSVVNGRGGESINFFSYFISLFVAAPLTFCFSLFGVKRIINKTPEASSFLNFAIFNLVWFLSMLIPLSLMSHKYVHYLILSFPGFALVSAYGVISLKDLWLERGHKVVLVLFVLLNFILLIFPVGSKSGRSKDLFKVKSYLELLNISKTEDWYVRTKRLHPEAGLDNEEISYWVGFTYSRNVNFLHENEILESIQKAKTNSVFLLEKNILKTPGVDHLKFLLSGRNCDCAYYLKN